MGVPMKKDPILRWGSLTETVVLKPFSCNLTPALTATNKMRRTSWPSSWKPSKSIRLNCCTVRAGERMPLFNCVQKETYKDIQINPALTSAQQATLRQLTQEYADIFSDVPKVTNLIEHKIKLKCTDPVMCRAYPVPYKLQETIDKEIQDMLSMNVIERSQASYSSPLVIVKKADGSNRVCVNFKALNATNEFDPEPMMTTEDIFLKLAQSKFYSKFDFC